MKLTHYAKTALRVVRSVQQDQEVFSPLSKPNGLWVSVDDSLGTEDDDTWPTWCRENDLRVAHLTVATRITLADRHNVLTLTTADAVTAFHRRWSVGTPFSSMHSPDWRAVAARYDGIIIAPYQWSLRLATETAWYYGWDVASGCIWNARAVAKLEVITEAP